MTAPYATLKAFPAPQVMCNTEDRKWALRNANHMFNNLKSRFLRQASNGPGNQPSDKQTITIGHDTTNGPALWVRNFTGDGKVLDWPLQEEVGIQLCNERLDGTGWRVVEIIPTLVNDTTRGFSRSCDKQWEKKIEPYSSARRKAYDLLNAHRREHGWNRERLAGNESLWLERTRLETDYNVVDKEENDFIKNNPRPKMPALKVVMEYKCQSAAKYPGQ